MIKLNIHQFLGQGLLGQLLSGCFPAAFSIVRYGFFVPGFRIFNLPNPDR